MKPGIIIIIMIHSELHNHFSLINVTALLSFLKAAGSSINLAVRKNSLGNNNFLVDVAHTHLHTIWDTQAVHTAKTNPQIHNKDGDADASSRPLGHSSHIHNQNESSGRAWMQKYLYHNVLSSSK